MDFGGSDSMIEVFQFVFDASCTEVKEPDLLRDKHSAFISTMTCGCHTTVDSLVINPADEITA